MAQEARIRLGVDGANDVRNAFRMIQGDMEKTGSVAGYLGKTLEGVARGVVRMGSDYAKVASGLKSTDFGEAAQNFKKYDEQITRMAVRGGKSVDDLRVKMRDAGRSAGVTGQEFAKSVKAFDRMSLAGLDESTEAMRSLGTYAADTDRSLEEMLEFGDAMWTKLGIPAQKFQSELNKIKSISNDIGLASGFLGIERSLIQLAPLLAQFSGGRNGASLGMGLIGAARESGLSDAAAKNAIGQILGGIESVDIDLIRRAYRQFKKDPNAEPLERTATGEFGYKGIPFLKFVRDQMISAPSTVGALRNILGTNIKGEAAKQLFLKPGFLERADQLSEVAELRDDISVVESERRANETLDAIGRYRKGLTHGMKAKDLVARPGASLLGAEAGRRLVDDLDRENIDSRTGEGLTRAQDAVRDTLSPGQRAKLGTALPYLPGDVQDVGYGAVGALGAFKAAVREGTKEGMQQATKQKDDRAAFGPAVGAALSN